MTKKDITDLLKPSIVFVMIAFAAFFMFYKTHKAANDVIAEQQRLNWMADQVQNGKQITTDKAFKIFSWDVTVLTRLTCFSRAKLKCKECLDVQLYTV